MCCALVDENKSRLVIRMRKQLTTVTGRPYSLHTRIQVAEMACRPNLDMHANHSLGATRVDTCRGILFLRETCTRERVQCVYTLVGE